MDTYFLFGSPTCTIFGDEGVDGLVEAFETDAITEEPTVFKFEDGVTTPTELLGAFCGFEDYICISEEEYEEIKTAFNI